MRYNFYPKIPDMSRVKPGQIRCGEHTDYGAITVLFQDEIGGLEVHVQCSQECKKIACFTFFRLCPSSSKARWNRIIQANVWKIIHLNCGERPEDMKFKPEENSGLNEIRTFHLCGTGAVFYHLLCSFTQQDVILLQWAVFHVLTKQIPLHLIVSFLVCLGLISGPFGLSHAKIQNKARPNSSEMPPKRSKDTAARYKWCRTNLGKVRILHTGYR